MIDPDILDRLRAALDFPANAKFVALSVDRADVEALLLAVTPPAPASELTTVGG